MHDEKTEARLLGVDVGFSAKRPTTGIAALDAGKIHLARAGTSWESRVSQIPDGFRPSVIAIDGPLLPQGADNLIRRLLREHQPGENPLSSATERALSYRRRSARPKLTALMNPPSVSV